MSELGPIHQDQVEQTPAWTSIELDPLACCGCWMYVGTTALMTIAGAVLAPKVGLSRVEGAAIGAGASLLVETLITWWANKKFSGSEHEVMIIFDQRSPEEE